VSVVYRHLASRQTDDRPDRCAHDTADRSGGRAGPSADGRRDRNLDDLESAITGRDATHRPMIAIVIEPVVMRRYELGVVRHRRAAVIDVTMTFHHRPPC